MRLPCEYREGSGPDWVSPARVGRLRFEMSGVRAEGERAAGVKVQCPWRPVQGTPMYGSYTGRMRSWQSRGKTAWRQQETAGGVKGKESVPRTDDGAQAQRPRPGGGPLHLPRGSPAWAALVPTEWEGKQGWSRLGEGRRGCRHLSWEPRIGTVAGGGTGLKPPAHMCTVTARAQHKAGSQGLGRQMPRDRRKGGPGEAVLGGSWAGTRGSPLLGASVFSVKEEAGPRCWGRRLEVQGEGGEKQLSAQETVHSRNVAGLTIQKGNHVKGLPRDLLGPSVQPPPLGMPQRPSFSSSL